jgi:hypothetical protein
MEPYVHFIVQKPTSTSCPGTLTVLVDWHVARPVSPREKTLPDSFKQFRERDAQSTRQPKQVLEGRVPASGFDPTQIGPVHLGQFRQALLGQTSLAAWLPGCRRAAVTPTKMSELGLSAQYTLDAGIIDVLRWSAGTP